MYDNIKGFQIIFLNNTINTSLKQKDKKKKTQKNKERQTEGRELPNFPQQLVQLTHKTTKTEEQINQPYSIHRNIHIYIHVIPFLALFGTFSDEQCSLKVIPILIKKIRELMSCLL